MDGRDLLAVAGARIKVIGIGGAGGNAVNTMLERWETSSPPAGTGVEFIAANTDLQALKGNRSPRRLQMGRELTRGLGAGADPEIGRKSALESEAELTGALEGSDLVFVTAGMGGGTGTGAAPVVARIAKDLGALTIGVVTRPFHFEGRKRDRQAEEGIESLRESVDSLITIPNERLLAVAGKEMTMVEAFRKADEVLLHAVRGISDLILRDGLINLDFADIRAVMRETGMTLMGSGVASGEHRSIEAATRAISSPLLENVSIRGATGILLNVTGGPDLTLFEVNEAAQLIQEEAHEEANIIFGAVIDGGMADGVRVTVIATGFHKGRGLADVAPSLKPAGAARVVASPPEAKTCLPKANACLPKARVPEAMPRNVISLSRDLNRLQGNPEGLPGTAGEEDEYDIPTFLRKRAD